MDARAIADRILGGDRGALARAISLCEDSPAAAAEILAAFCAPSPRSVRIGLTGPPGAGKSTLVSQLIARLAHAHKRVGAVMIDPSSPISGGAVMGDRIRLGSESDADGVYVRSLASRGSLGGLCAAAAAAVRLIEHWGAGATIIETVGIGQAGSDIAWLADTVFLVLSPGAGDSIQAMKSGVIEIADAYVVNKCDLPGADKTALMLAQELTDEYGHTPAIIATNARSGDGVDALLRLVAETSISNSTDPDKVARAERKALLELRFAFESLLLSKMEANAGLSDEMTKLSGDIAAGQIDVFTAASMLLNKACM